MIDREGLAKAIFYAYEQRVTWEQAKESHRDLFLHYADAAIEYLRGAK